MPPALRKSYPAAPTTLAEQWFEVRSGATPYTQGFLVHYLDKLIYPQLPEAVVTWSGAVICAAILGVHCIRLSRAKLTQPEKT